MPMYPPLIQQLDRQEDLKYRLDHGLVKHKRTRNPLLAESTIAGGDVMLCHRILFTYMLCPPQYSM
jgi:hypothetical protein